MSKKDSIIVIGANGQIGSVLVPALRHSFGNDNVLATDLKKPVIDNGRFEILDALDAQRLAEMVDQYKVTQIYLLAAILSARGEADPLQTWRINMNCLFNALEVAREKKITKVFFPSTIAVFGKNVPKENTPQQVHLVPETVYGMTKVAGENWCNYYFQRYGLDVRSLRYPGIIGYQSMPGGGTTDYAVDIYHKAILGEHFSCFLEPETRLPMMYMEDAIRATLELMEAPAELLQTRTSYNVSGMSFAPKDIAAAIQKIIPGFTISYEPDFRQAIAASWPASINNLQAKKDWGWKPKYNLHSMTKDMISQLRKQYSAKNEK